MKYVSMIIYYDSIFNLMQSFSAISSVQRAARKLINQLFSHQYSYTTGAVFKKYILRGYPLKNRSIASASESTQNNFCTRLLPQSLPQTFQCDVNFIYRLKAAHLLVNLYLSCVKNYQTLFFYIMHCTSNYFKAFFYTKQRF